jgi:hypothetical protein
MTPLALALKRIDLAEALPIFRLRLRFDDGIEGVVDLSSEAGKGVFAIWATPQAFADFRIENGRRVVWSHTLDLCADALYLEITGRQPEDLFPQLKSEPARA